jgi:chaperone modulatory protein CbpM
MAEREAVTAVVIEETALTIHDVAIACSVSTQWVVRHVEEGALHCSGAMPEQWRFSGSALARARRIRALERHFEAGPELAALVADMLDEIDRLRARLRRAGLD